MAWGQKYNSSIPYSRQMGRVNPSPPSVSKPPVSLPPMRNK
jgi:hypothetical protein